MAEVAKGIIDIEINTGDASAALKQLQQQINAFNMALSKQNKNQAIFAADYAKELQLAVQKTGLFTAETIRLTTAAATLDKTLGKGKATLGQFFSAKFNKDSAMAAEVMALASERAKAMQTQFIATSGAAKGMQEALAIRPLAAFSSETALASQRAEILSSMFKQGTTQLINFGKNVQWAGRQLMVGFTVPLTIFGNTAGKTFMELEKQAVSFKKVYGDIFTTPAEVNKNLQAVTDLGKEYTKYGIAVKDTISLAAQAAAAGRKNKDLTDAVSQATRLATLGQMDQNSALETTISLQSAFRLSGKDLADTINFLNMVENQTVVSLQDIAAAIPRVAPVIQGLGGDVKDLTVFLAAMQEGGVDAAEGANALKSGLASLINPTKAAKEMLSGFGINLDAIIKANKGDLMGTVMTFSKALQNLDQFQRQQSLEQVFGKFQYAKLGALFDNISRQGSQAQQVIATMGYSTEQLGATADKELKTIEESFGVQLTAAVERFKLAIAPIGEIFVKTAIPIVNFLTGIIEKFNGLSEGKKQFIAIATIITGVVIPAGTMLLGLLLNLTGTLAKIVQGFGAFAKGFVTGGPIGAIKALTQSSKYFTLAEIDAANAAQQLAGASQAVNAAFIEQASAAGVAGGAVNALTATYNKLIAAQTAAAGLPTFGTAGKAAKGIKTIKRAKGGTIPGVGNSDTVPAMLTPGEYVINKKATSANLPLLEAINNGQRLNSGGIVQYLNKGAIVRSLIDLVRRGAGTSKDVMEGTHSPEVKALFSRYMSIYGKQSTGKNVVPNLDSVRSGYMPANIANSILSMFGVGSRTKKSSRLLGNWGMLLPKQLNTQLVHGQASGKDLINFSSNPNNLIDLERFLRFNNVDDKTIAKVKQNVAKSIAGNIDSNKLYNDPEFGKLAFLATTKEIKGLEKAFPGINLSYQKDRMTPGRRDTQSSSSRHGPSGTAVNAPGGRGSGYGSGKDGMVWAHWHDQAFEENIGSLAKSLGWTFKNSGGFINGTGNKDTVPAMLTPGEFVVNKKAASKHGQMLKAMNSGGIVKGFEDGGLVQDKNGKWRRANGQYASSSEIAAMSKSSGRISRFGTGAGRLGAGLAGYAIGEKIGGMPGGMIGSLVAEKAFGTIAKTALPLIKNMSVMSRVLGGTGVGAFVALGFEAYKLQKQVSEAKDAGAKMTRAMYGTAKSTEAMAKFFGKQTYATAATLSAVEKMSGTAISAEAQQASTGFIESDAGKQLVKDISTVKSGGGNAIEALRNQLSAGIIAGAIGPEEANAIAVEVGNALGDQTIAVSVAGQLNELIGKDGKDILKNLSTITAEISPKINTTELAANAQSAYEKLNAGQKFMQIFGGGAEGFKRDYKASQISDSIAASYRNEANALGLLNAAHQNETISFKEYTDKRSEVSKNSAASLDATAKSLGFNSYSEMVQGAKGTTTTITDYAGNTTTSTTYSDKQLAAKKAIEGQRDAYKQMLESAGVLPERIDEILKQADEIGGTILGDLISGKVQPVDLEFVNRVSGDMDATEYQNFIEKLSILRQMPNIDKIIDFKTAGEKEVNAAYDLYLKVDALDTVKKKVDFIYETTGFNMTKDQYNQFAALPDVQQKAFITEYVTRKTEIDQKISVEVNEKGGKASLQRIASLNKQAENLFSDIIKPLQIQASTSPTLDGTSDGGGSGGKGKTFAEMKKALENRFDLVSKRLDLEASKYEKVNRELERQNELDRRAIDQLSEKENSVNKFYDAQIEALDKVERANERIAQQEKSRIDLTSALASGNIGAAAAAMSEIQSQNASYQIEDTRAALENSRQESLKNITADINGQMLTRDQIEERIKNRELEMQKNQDALYKIEQDRLKNAEALEKVQVRSYLLEQKKNIDDLEKKKNKKKLTAEEKGQLADYKAAASALAAAYGIDMKFQYGGVVKKFASGGFVGGSGNTDKVRALLTPGEYVVRKSVARQNMPLLEALNNQMYPSMSSPSFNVPSSATYSTSGSPSAPSSSTVYNDTYNINVNVSGSNSSADEIANVVLAKISRNNSSVVRGSSY